MKRYVNKLGIGIIGCGNISDIYLENLSKVFKEVNLIGCADIVEEKAREKSEQYNIGYFTVDELLNSEDIDIVVNLTIPKAHREVCEQALRHGKHVYVEKPLSLSTKDGKNLLEIAKEKGLQIKGTQDKYVAAQFEALVRSFRDREIGRTW